MHRDEDAARRPVEDRAAPEPQRAQLLERHDRVLRRRDRTNRAVDMIE
jgi:hypothetical protein